MPGIGIDDLNVCGGAAFIDARAIAAARGGPDPDKLELVRRSVPAAFEDPVTLAVEAARPVVGDPARFGLLIVATESGVDDAKPLSSYVHHWLGLPATCRHVELKHACYGGTAALRLAADWVRADPERAALVVTTDLARRLFDHPAEAAEGAGAVAMTVTAEPRVLRLGDHSACAAREIYDVMRPTRRSEVIHAQRSLSAYLDLLEATWDGFCATAGPCDLRYVLYHTPLLPLVRQAHRMITDGGQEDFAARVLPSTAFGQQLGNTYSGSLYVALASLAHHVSVEAPTRIGLYSYGSGSCAEFFDGWLQPTASARVRRHRIDERIAARQPLAVPEYEALVEAVESSLADPDFRPDPGAAATGQLVLDHVRSHYRSYRWS